MKILENLKLDRWYGIVLYLGVMLVAASLYVKVDFIEEKHLFGFGLGMILIGLSYFMAEQYVSLPVQGAMLSTQRTKHSPVSVVLLMLGIGLVGLFGFLVVKILI